MREQHEVHALVQVGLPLQDRRQGVEGEIDDRAGRRDGNPRQSVGPRGVHHVAAPSRLRDHVGDRSCRRHGNGHVVQAQVTHPTSPFPR